MTQFSIAGSETESRSALSPHSLPLLKPARALNLSPPPPPQTPDTPHSPTPCDCCCKVDDRLRRRHV